MSQPSLGVNGSHQPGGRQSPEELQDIIAWLATEFGNLQLEQLDHALTDALRSIGQFAGADRAYVFLVRGDRMSNTNEWCSPGTTPQIANLQNVPVTSYEWCMSHILKGNVLHIPSVSKLPDEQPDKDLLLSEEIKSLLAVPITSRSRVIGFVGFDAVRSEQRWTREILALLKIVGSIFGGAIERHESDAALRKEQQFSSNVIETAGSLVIVLAPDGRFLRVNRAFIELTGLSAEELGETDWHRLIPEESRDHARSALRTALSGTSVQFEGLLRSRHEELRTILWNGAVSSDQHGDPSYVVVTGLDMTEVRHLREQVEQSRRLDSLGRVAAEIAHEFNNVLMAILPSAEMIRRHPGETVVVRNAAERIESAVKRGEMIAREVTRFARPAEPLTQEIDVRKWTRALVEEMRIILVARSGPAIRFEDLTPNEALYVSGDPDQLQQVFSNLILNAADATPGGGNITVSLAEVSAHERLPEAGPPGTRWLHWQVCDTGSGIAPAVLDRIFEPLFTTKRKGTGLGLAVAHQIIKTHHGGLTVETAVGKGTTFHVFLRRRAGT